MKKLMQCFVKSLTSPVKATIATQSQSVDLVASFTLLFLGGNRQVLSVVCCMRFINQLKDYFHRFNAERVSPLEWIGQPSNNISTVFREMSLDGRMTFSCFITFY
jgi:hypothetical protein